jgi:hypothetical protein
MQKRLLIILGFLFMVSFVPAFGQDAEAPPPAPAPPPPDLNEPKMVDVKVKIVEFQATKGVETGVNAFFARRNRYRAYNRLTSGRGAITSADLTFPIENSAITVFLDQIRMSEGDLEIVLQGLVNESLALILSRPRAKVMVRQAVPMIVTTVKDNPFEEPLSVGNNLVTITRFKKTGVTLNIGVPDLTDDDGDWATTDDSYVRLDITAQVDELGGEVDIQTGFTAPSYTNRMIKTTVWVRHGQMLILGGLYRNRKAKEVASVPWLNQGEKVAVGAAERVVPGNVLVSPLSSTLGSRRTTEERRELVFFIKTETWRPAYTVFPDESAFDGFEEEEIDAGRTPTDYITNVGKKVIDAPKAAVERVSGESVTTRLGADMEGSE